MTICYSKILVFFFLRAVRHSIWRCHHPFSLSCLCHRHARFHLCFIMYIRLRVSRRMAYSLIPWLLKWKMAIFAAGSSIVDGFSTFQIFQEHTCVELFIGHEEFTSEILNCVCVVCVCVCVVYSSVKMHIPCFLY